MNITPDIYNKLESAQDTLYSSFASVLGAVYLARLNHDEELALELRVKMKLIRTVMKEIDDFIVNNT